MVWTTDVHRHVVRRRRVAWLTHPPSGTGRVESESRAFGVMPATLPTADPVPAKAAPGELLAVSDPDRALAFASVQKAARYYGAQLSETDRHQLGVHAQRNRQGAAKARGDAARAQARTTTEKGNR